MKDTIYREDAVNAMYALVDGCVCDDPYRENPHIDAIIDTLENLPPAQPKTGRWINNGVSGGDDIEEWQECQCSECGRWDTRPYMYYFSEPNYCSYCGAKMQRGEQDEN